MNQQKAGFSNNKRLTLILILAVVICSITFGFWIGTFSPKGLEKIYFDSCEWDDGCVLSIANTGAEDLIINKVWINGTLLDSTEWESFPCMRFQPGDQGTLCIAASLEIFQQGTTYEFTIQTLAGNSFSYIAKPQPNQFTWFGTEELTISTLTWTGPNTGFSLKIDNTGTGDVTITQIQVNYGTTGVTQPANLPLQLRTAAGTTLTVGFQYSNGTAYDISIVTSSGYKFTDHFTGGQNKPAGTYGQDVQLREITTSWNNTANTITVYLSNQGTADGKIDSVYIGTSATNLNLQGSVTYYPESRIIASHETISIVLSYTWEFNKEYYFKIHPEVGADCEFHKTSPAS